MKIGVVALLAFSRLGLQAADNSQPAVYKSASELMSVLKQNEAKNPAQADSPIDNQSRYRINIVHREKPGVAMAHATGPAKGTEVHYIIDGSATVVTGGTLHRAPSVNGKRGVSSIEGGIERHVSKGDVIVIPAGTPHWYKSIDGSVTYLEVRFDVDGK